MFSWQIDAKLYSTFRIISISLSLKCTPFLFSFFLHSVIDNILHSVAHLHFLLWRKNYFLVKYDLSETHDHGESDTDRMHRAHIPVRQRCLQIKKMFAENHFLKNKVVSICYTTKQTCCPLRILSKKELQELLL